MSFLLFSTIQFRDGPFIRPHPAFWRIVLGVNLLYELALVFLLFQDIGSARELLTYIDPNLGRPLQHEKSYGENCAFTVPNILVSSVPSTSESIPTSSRMLSISSASRMLWAGLVRL